MKNLKVNYRNYALFDYTPYLDRNSNPIPHPSKLKYDLGDVVYIRHTNAIGVVIGCIAPETGELRTDMDGMVAFSDIEPARKYHFNTSDVRVCDRLRKELFEKKVK